MTNNCHVASQQQNKFPILKNRTSKSIRMYYKFDQRCQSHIKVEVNRSRQFKKFQNIDINHFKII